ncbi:hypothetical protein ZWY2020_054352 [Hordeum vulgare]|nr:hypothetical protein ZWY2020_054352 [Hordeum vulgare]
MARVAAPVALFVLVSLNKDCRLPEQSVECSAWCQSDCRGGECVKCDGLHFCHCYC